MRLDAGSADTCINTHCGIWATARAMVVHLYEGCTAASVHSVHTTLKAESGVTKCDQRYRA